MLFQLIIAVGLFTFLLNTTLNLVLLKRPRKDAPLPVHPPLVSVLVPARNEQENIQTCIESLCRQDYPNLEILVLDDNSEDATVDIVQEIASRDKRVQLYHGNPLPEDWAGKPYACAQLATQAHGEWLLFVDADTVHETHMLRSVLALAREQGTSLLSGFPRQLANSFPQKVGIPLIYFIIMSWFPIWWLQHPSHPRGSLAIGQFLLFRRSDYQAIGGHATVSSRILEDVWLGIETVRHGGHHLAIDLTSVTACNMYRNVGGMWEGFTKWFYSVASLCLPGLVALIIAAYFFYVAPFFFLWQRLVTDAGPPVWDSVILFQVGNILVLRFLISIRLRESILSALLHLPGIIFIICNAIIACFRWVTGAGVTWKNRAYDRESAVK